MSLISYIADSCTKCINFVSDLISHSSKKEELAVLDKEVFQLRYPSKRELFFNEPDAKAQLTRLVADAKRLGHTNAVRHLEDYLSDLEKIEIDNRNKPFELLKAMIEKDGILRPYLPVVQTSNEEPLQGDVPLEVSQEEPTSTQQPLQPYEWNAKWDLYLNLEIDELTEKLNGLTMDGDPLVLVQEAKRPKNSHEDLGHIASVAMMENSLSYKLWLDKNEIQSMQRSLNESANREISKKAPR